MSKLLDFLHASFTDATRRPDGKLLTIAAVAVIVVATYPVGWVFQRWPPEYIFSPTLLFLAAGLGIDAYVTHTAIKARADVEQAQATGQPVPPDPAPAADVQVTTTINEAAK